MDELSKSPFSHVLEILKTGVGMKDMALGVKGLPGRQFGSVEHVCFSFFCVMNHLAKVGFLDSQFRVESVMVGKSA